MTVLEGTLDLADGLSRLAVLETPASPELALGEVEVVHAIYETTSLGVLAALPAALFPSNPGILSWLVYKGNVEPFGDFALAITRVGCVAGMARRALVVSCVTDNERLADVLRNHWGLTVALGSVAVQPRADCIGMSVTSDGEPRLAVEIYNPVLLPTGVAVPILGGLHLVNTMDGPGIIEVETRHQPLEPAERGRPRVVSFDAAWWGVPSVTPLWPVIGSYQHCDVVLPTPTRMFDPAVPAALGVVTLGT